jgi:hypothetical protein
MRRTPQGQPRFAGESQAKIKVLAMESNPSTEIAIYHDFKRGCLDSFACDLMGFSSLCCEGK